MAEQRVILHPVDGFSGTLRAPGDKSLSHRLAMLAGVAEGRTFLSGFLRSGDCLHTLRAMEQLGARVEDAGDGFMVEGTAGAPRQPDRPLDMGNSGTGMRLLSGLLASYPLTVDLTGDESLSRRPMDRIRIPLEQMGAGIRSLGGNGTPPLSIEGGALKGIDYRLPMASAQVKSAILLAGIRAEGHTVVHEPRMTRDHTENVLKAWGLPVRVDGLTISIEGRPGSVLPRVHDQWRVPGDVSSSAFWWAAAAGREGAEIRVDGVGLNPRRTAVLDVLRRMGADVDIRQDEALDPFEPMGSVVVRGRGLAGTLIEGEEIPNLIDELPMLSALAALAEGETVIRDAEELRKKESDRIRVMAQNLSALGVRVEERPDGMVIEGPASLDRSNVQLDSCGDHRIAMAMAVLAGFGRTDVRLNGAACIATSYPGWWDDYRALGGEYAFG